MIKDKVAALRKSIGIEKTAQKLYHLSADNLDGQILEPRIPDNAFTRHGREENKTPRISFSSSIDGALAGITGDLTGKEFYIHEIDDSFSNPEIKNITTAEVPDQFVTDEAWVLNNTKLRNAGKIRVTRTFPQKRKQGRGSMTYNAYEWEPVPDEDYVLKEAAALREQLSDAELQSLKDLKIGKRNLSQIEKLQLIGEAGNMANIKYVDRKGMVSQRNVEPYKLSENDFWAYDPAKGGIRRFKVNQIKSVKATKEQYLPRWDKELDWAKSTHSKYLPVPAQTTAIVPAEKQAEAQNYLQEAGLMICEKIAALREGVTLYPHQQMALDTTGDSAIFAHATGSGKTLTGIAKAERLMDSGKSQGALVVVPSGLRNNFKEKGVEKFTDRSANIIGNKQEISKKLYNAPDPNADYNIISYDIFKKDPVGYLKATGADTIITDESHKSKNEQTLSTEVFRDPEVREYFKNYIGLTGSVVSNSPADMQPLVDIASKGTANIGKTKDEFDKMFVRRDDTGVYKQFHEKRRPIIGFRNKPYLKEQLGNYINYISHDDIKETADFPDENLKVKKVPLSKEQAKYYKMLINENPKMKELVRNKRLETLKDDEAAKAFTTLSESRKLVNSIGSVVPGIPLDESALRSPKVKKLLDDLEVELKTDPQAQALLFSHLINGGIDVMEAGLKDRGIPYGKFIGKGNEGVTEQSRQQAVRDIENKRKRVMLISSAGGEGISLGDTTWEGVLDPHYNPEKMKQMEARGVRAGGLKNRPDEDRVVDVNRYISTMPKILGFIPSPTRTPDEMIYEIAMNKERQNQLVFDLLTEIRKEREARLGKVGKK